MHFSFLFWQNGVDLSKVSPVQLKQEIEPSLAHRQNLMVNKLEWEVETLEQAKKVQEQNISVRDLLSTKREPLSPRASLHIKQSPSKKSPSKSPASEKSQETVENFNDRLKNIITNALLDGSCQSGTASTSRTPTNVQPCKSDAVMKFAQGTNQSALLQQNAPSRHAANLTEKNVSLIRDVYSPISRPSSSSSTASAESVKYLVHGQRVPSPNSPPMPHFSENLMPQRSYEPESDPDSLILHKHSQMQNLSHGAGMYHTPSMPYGNMGSAAAMGVLPYHLPAHLSASTQVGVQGLLGLSAMNGLVAAIPGDPSSKVPKSPKRRRTISGSKKSSTKDHGSKSVTNISKKGEKTKGIAYHDTSKMVATKSLQQVETPSITHCSTSVPQTVPLLFKHEMIGATTKPMAPEIASMVSTASQPLKISAVSDPESNNASPSLTVRPVSLPESGKQHILY